MSETAGGQILSILQERPGQKADELARALGSTRTEVNQLLYGPLKSKVRQDSSYRWSLTPNAQTPSVNPSSEGPVVETDLARLCRYYLACLGYDDAGVSTFLTSKYGDPDFVEARTIPRSSTDLADDTAARRMLGRKRTEQGRYGLFFGYPTHIAQVRSRKSDWEGLMVEPILLFPIEQESGTGRLTVDLSFPIINQKPFQAFTSAERDGLMNELVQLEQELGIGAGDERPELDEVAMRLQAVRSEWPWREAIDPTVMSDDREPLTEIKAPGIYNRAVIVMAEKSPYTQGLEKELRELGSLSEQAVAGTALSRWLRKDDKTDKPPPSLTSPLLEVLPMNSEQRQAVATALTMPLTVITGPPGTGKSQVVTNLLINAAWMGKRVLLASKNNKAVDVVDTRANALGPRPILIRVGGQAYQARLAEFILALMSATTSPAEREEFEDAKSLHQRLVVEHQRLAEEARDLVALRNEVDCIEQEVEEARRRLGAVLFGKALDVDQSAAASAVSEVVAAANRADRSRATFFSRLFWPLMRAGRIKALALVCDAERSSFQLTGATLPTIVEAAHVPRIQAAARDASTNLLDLAKAGTYLSALKRLQQARTLEEIGKNEADLSQRIARHSGMLWKLWLRLQPSRLSSEERRQLSQYKALLGMVVEAGDDGQLSRQVHAQYAEMLRKISHLLPCWAVTSLSARGRIPFEAGVFDIVVFDEASQCDIASALPLMYRAKSVVVIGDPKQLGHISGLQKGQDQALLEKHGLMAEYPHWAFSHQSLFGLAASQIAGHDVANLVDHHRSHADIIGFSNKEFYEDRLRVATSYDRLRSPDQKEPGIRWVDVRGRVTRPPTGGAVNPIEADAIVATLRDLVLSKRYEGSVGVVTPFRAQANRITQAVNADEVLASALVRRGFLADTVHKFQGDERDVMLFSPVVSDGLPPGATGFLRSNGNLFNVAITRARAQLIVVGDIAACGACDVGYLSRFASYASSLSGVALEVVGTKSAELGSQYPSVARPELVSDWERDFYVAAYRAGLRLIPQFPVEKYLADFLLVDGERQLAIEIDGERYHRNWTGELCRRDQIRNQRFFELGYDVIRFWVYEVRDDIAGCIRRLQQWKDRVAVPITGS